MRLLAMFFAVLLIYLRAFADDGAASIAAGGLVLMKHEPRITMAKEVLQISPTKVVVDYDFRNDSDAKITTAVAFPVPAYKFGDEEEVFGDPSFRNFKLDIDGQPHTFSTEVRAFVGSHEVTTLLMREGIDADTFGHWDTKEHDFAKPAADFIRATPTIQQRLIASGAFTKDGMPAWRVEKKYYWTQTFPGHATVHIRHLYSPVLGGTNSVRYGLEAEQLKNPPPDARESEKEINSLCLEPMLKARLLKLSRDEKNSVPFNYVDFILTSANTWKTPIEDFTLIVERPQEKLFTDRSNQELVSFCWAGPVIKLDAYHFQAHLKDFVPKKELRIGFIHANPTIER